MYPSATISSSSTPAPYTSYNYYYFLPISKLSPLLNALHLCGGPIIYNVGFSPNISNMFVGTAPSSMVINRILIMQDILAFKHPVPQYNLTSLTSIGLKEYQSSSTSFSLTLSSSGVASPNNVLTADKQSIPITYNPPITTGVNKNLYIIPYIQSIVVNSGALSNYNTAISAYQTAPNNDSNGLYNACSLNQLFDLNLVFVQISNQQVPFSTNALNSQTNIDASIPYWITSYIQSQSLTTNGTGTNSVLPPTLYNKFFKGISIDLENITAESSTGNPIQLIVNYSIILNPIYQQIFASAGAFNITFNFQSETFNTFYVIYQAP